MKKKIGIIGLGTVGEATVRSLLKQRSLVRSRTSLQLDIKAVSDKDQGKRKLMAHLGLSFSSDPYSLINDSAVDIIVELIGGVNPAKQYIEAALRNGKDIVTANKALLAQCGEELFSLARRHKRSIGFEASVCGAVPLIKSISEGLVGCQVKSFYGIVNGTTNYILCKMEEDSLSFSQALLQAKEKGFAEGNAALDVHGIDSLHKLAILNYLCFGFWPRLKHIPVTGISRVSLLDILYARQLNYSIKLLVVAKKEGNELDLRVHPALVPFTHPLSKVNEAYNAVWVDTYPAGKLLFYGEGAGGVPTSSAVISDIVNISFDRPRVPGEARQARLKSAHFLTNRYYIRFMAQDKPGVLAQISKILASSRISIASVTQKERVPGRFVPIVMLTHEAEEKRIRKAIAAIDALALIRAPSQVLRIEDL